MNSSMPYSRFSSAKVEKPRLKCSSPSHYRVEPDPVAKLDLRQDIVVPLLLGKAGRARQLIEKPEAHAFHPLQLADCGSMP